MMLRTALARLRYGAGTLLLEPLWLAALVAMLTMAAAVLFILGAQFTRLGSTGEWRGVPLSEFLEIVRISQPAEPTDQQRQVLGFILALPATLVLAVSALGCWIIGRAINHVRRRERGKFHSFRQKAMIGDIEREFQKTQT